MATKQILMPKMGESVMEGTIISWLKKVGEYINQDEPLLEVATDKVDTEIPSEYEGILTQILVNEGDIALVGNPIAVIETESKKDTTPPSTKTTKSQNYETNEAKVENKPTIIDTIKTKSNKFFSPLVRNIAKAENISFDELEKIEGTGLENRVTKYDLQKYLNDKKSTQTIKVIQPAQAQAIVMNSEDEIIEMDRMRKIIAERMLESKRISPHVTSFVEVDMQNIVQWRNKYNQKFKQNYGYSLTYTPFFIEASVKAIIDFPLINIQVNGTKIIKKRQINIGMATALDTEKLIVPVIHNANQFNLLGLAQKVNDLTSRAKNQKLTTEDLANGTFTISNVGIFGNVMGTPIIMQPQVAILAVGAIQKKPAVIETPQGDFIGIRHKVFLSLSYDHRVIDGALGGSFLKKIATNLENFDISQSI